MKQRAWDRRMTPATAAVVGTLAERMLHSRGESATVTKWTCVIAPRTSRRAARRLHGGAGTRHRSRVIRAIGRPSLGRRMSAVGRPSVAANPATTADGRRRPTYDIQPDRMMISYTRPEMIHPVETGRTPINETHPINSKYPPEMILDLAVTKWGRPIQIARTAPHSLKIPSGGDVSFGRDHGGGGNCDCPFGK